MNRILIKLYVPLLEKKYDIWIPINKSIYYCLNSFLNGIDAINKIQYVYGENYPRLYNKETADVYNVNSMVVDTDIRNGTELILF